MADRQTAVSCI